MAIFGPSAARSIYYVTTLNRRMPRGDAIMVGGDVVRRVYEFLDDQYLPTPLTPSKLRLNRR
jgi:hypothetical protein